MPTNRLYNIASHYVDVIEQIEKTQDPEQLVHLEEERAMWHDKLIQQLRREGIPFADREHVTQLAYRLAQGWI